MNLWGFAEPILDELDARARRLRPGRPPPTPRASHPSSSCPMSSAGPSTEGRALIRVVASNSRCIGLTHPDDLPLVRSLIAEGIAG